MVQNGAARLCFNGITAVPYDAKAVTDALAGSSMSDSDIDSAISHLKVEDPLGDVHASGEYRIQLAKVYGARALKLARDRANG